MSNTEQPAPYQRLPRIAKQEAETFEKILILEGAIKDLQKGLFCRGTWFRDGGAHDLDFLFDESEAQPKSYGRDMDVTKEWVYIPTIKDWNLVEASRMMKCAEGSIAFATAWLGFAKPVFEQVRDLVNQQLLTFPHSESQKLDIKEYVPNPEPTSDNPHPGGEYQVVSRRPICFSLVIDYNPDGSVARKRLIAELSAHNDRCLGSDPAGTTTADGEAIDNLVQLFAATIREQLGESWYEPPERLPIPVEISLEPAILNTEATPSTSQPDDDPDTSEYQDYDDQEDL